MKRKPDHVLAYFLAELGNEGSIDGNSRLMLKGRFVPKKIESVLRNYISAFFWNCVGSVGVMTIAKFDVQEKLPTNEARAADNFAPCFHVCHAGAYVTCKMCRSPNTTLTKDPVSRLFFVNCKQCNASRAVTTIRIGARAVKRGERRKARR